MNVVEKYRLRRDKRMRKRLDDDWITVNGTHVMVDDKGEVTKGPDALKSGGVIKDGKNVFTNLHGKKGNGFYWINGDMTEPGGRVWRDAAFKHMKTKDEMYALLKENGVTSFKDPDTGEEVNPSKMDIKTPVARDSNGAYKEVSVGLRRTYGGIKEYAVVGTGYDGKKHQLKVVRTPKEARDFLKKIKCKEEDARMTRDVRQHLTPSIK